MLSCVFDIYSLLNGVDCGAGVRCGSVVPTVTALGRLSGVGDGGDRIVVKEASAERPISIKVGG